MSRRCFGKPHFLLPDLFLGVLLFRSSRGRTRRPRSHFESARLQSARAPPAVFYLLDRGYVDFPRLYVLAQACAFFVTRAKKNM
jgi:hypothetical protein